MSVIYDTLYKQQFENIYYRDVSRTFQSYLNYQDLRNAITDVLCSLD
jgi:hypothetical protein